MKSLYKSFQFILFALLLSQCDCDDSIEKKEELPPVTQTGANTFGCLVNDKVWVPTGNHGTPNLDLSYDPTFNKGTFDLRAVRYLADGKQEYIILFSDSLSSEGSYSLTKGTHQVVTFSNDKTCYYSTNDSETQCTGILSITKFDLAKGIISGEFNFSITSTNCDPVIITQGRFDMKI